MPAVAVILAYLIGSIPFGLIITKMGWKADPRLAGSGNIGFTNVYRVAGMVPAILTLIADAGKGLGAALAAQWFLDGDLWLFATGLAAILGHNYSCFLKGQGGKGVATSFGVLFGLHLPVALLTLTVWMATLVVARRVSIASMAAFGVLPAWALIFPLVPSRLLSLVGALAMAVLIIFSHRDNLKRIRHGLEAPLD